MNKYQNLIKKLGKNRIKYNEPMAIHTTIGIGGPADLFYIAKTKTELIKAVNLANKDKIPYFVLGGGSNILITNKGIRGLVIKNNSSRITRRNLLVKVESGVITQKLVNFTIEKGLAGLEYFSGFYGTVGGAIYNNAHFKDKFIFDPLEKIEILTKAGKKLLVDKNKVKHGYDFTSFQKTKDLILELHFKLKKGNKKLLNKTALEVLKIRRQKHPMAKKSAGCMFKNPKLAPAGILIDRAGLKGKKVGEAMVSEKHAAFIINKGNASCQDVLKLISLIKRQVYNKFKVNLQTEVFLIGEK